MRITKQEVIDYMSWRSGEELRHCPNSVAAACNDAARKFNHFKAKDFLKLIFFNDPIPVLHTHSYGFHTASGRNIIQTVQEFYHEYNNLEL